MRIEKDSNKRKETKRKEFFKLDTENYRLSNDYINGRERGKKFDWNRGLNRGLIRPFNAV